AVADTVLQVEILAPPCAAVPDKRQQARTIQSGLDRSARGIEECRKEITQFDRLRHHLSTSCGKQTFRPPHQHGNASGWFRDVRRPPEIRIAGHGAMSADEDTESLFERASRFQRYENAADLPIHEPDGPVEALP